MRKTALVHREPPITLIAESAIRPPQFVASRSQIKRTVPEMKTAGSAVRSRRCVREVLLASGMRVSTSRARRRDRRGPSSRPSACRPQAVAGQQQRGHAGRVLQRRARDLGRVDHARLDHVLVDAASRRCSRSCPPWPRPPSRTRCRRPGRRCRRSGSAGPAGPQHDVVADLLVLPEPVRLDLLRRPAAGPRRRRAGCLPRPRRGWRAGRPRRGPSSPSSRSRWRRRR